MINILIFIFKNRENKTLLPAKDLTFSSRLIKDGALVPIKVDYCE
ncbi:hypothetical protein Riv7116_3039 [Rivularia sp. PCC 7116]|nr:hypothetical protein Riv7116_3039 [Rivularia sp. PCC 7116]